MCDGRFLPQLLVLHRSLERHAQSFRLRVLCMDAESERVLATLRPPGLEIAPLAELEENDPALAAVRTQRTWREYCWTVTPALCRVCLDDAQDGDVLAWVDADIEFLRDPGALLDALGDGSILLTPHDYFHAYPKAVQASYLTQHWGRFNGGTIAFRRDDEGCAAAELWRSRSLEWCHDRLEPGRYGNQLHLDDFPERFASTRELPIPGGGLAPWNAAQYRIEPGGAGVAAEGVPITFYHHQSLRLYRRPADGGAPLPENMFVVPGHGGELVARTNPVYRITPEDRELVWEPYVDRLARALEDVGQDTGRFDVLTPERVGRDAYVTSPSWRGP